MDQSPPATPRAAADDGASPGLTAEAPYMSPALPVQQASAAEVPPVHVPTDLPLTLPKSLSLRFLSVLMFADSELHALRALSMAYASTCKASLHGAGSARAGR